MILLRSSLSSSPHCASSVLQPRCDCPQPVQPALGGRQPSGCCGGCSAVRPAGGPRHTRCRRVPARRRGCQLPHGRSIERKTPATRITGLFFLPAPPAQSPASLAPPFCPASQSRCASLCSLSGGHLCQREGRARGTECYFRHIVVYFGQVQEARFRATIWVNLRNLSMSKGNTAKSQVLASPKGFGWVFLAWEGRLDSARSAPGGATGRSHGVEQPAPVCDGKQGRPDPR